MFVNHQKMFNLTCVKRIVDQNFNKAIFTYLISKDLAHFDGEVLREQALSHCWWCSKLIQLSVEGNLAITFKLRVANPL